MSQQACARLPYCICDRDERRDRPEHLLQCREGMSKSTYRALIAAAALSEVYNAPSFLTESKITPENFSTEDADRLGRFLAYQTTCRAEDERAMFDGLAMWLRDGILTDISRSIMAERFRERRGRGLCSAGRVDDADAAGEQDDYALVSNDEDERSGEDEGFDEDKDKACPLQDTDGLSHSDVHLLIWETMQLLWAVEMIHACCDLGYEELGNTIGDCPLKTVFMVPFGAFRSVPMNLWKDGPSPVYDYAPAPAAEEASVSDFRKTYIKVRDTVRMGQDPGLDAWILRAAQPLPPNR